MKAQHAEAIRSARTEAKLTQEELGRRIGLSGRAIYRWERGEYGPTRRNRSALVTTISVLHPEAGQRLKAAFDGATSAAPRAVALAASPTSHDVAVQLSLLAFAHQLDAPPGRVRTALVRFCKQLASTQLTVDALRACVERVLPESEVSALTIPNQESPCFVAKISLRTKSF